MTTFNMMFDTLKSVEFSHNKAILCFGTTEIPGGIPEWSAGERLLQE